MTDQAGKVRRSVTNALGQLTRVDEPDAGGQLGDASSPTQPTYYTYDVLNNLTAVNQGVQTRNFAYNSLSRLVSAQNPESGTIQYSYDANGNLTSKVDARTITTAYTYDALNRVLTRTYTGETGYTTPNVSYFYDNLPNAKGRLTKVSSSVSTTEYTAFDILGRVTAAKQTTEGGDAAGYSTGYTYNLSGALIEETYPSGRKVKNVLDNNGELSLVQSARCGVVNGVTATCSDPQGYFSYAKSFTYNAAGAVTSMQLGNGRWESTTFNSRLQPTQIALGSTQNAIDTLKLDYSYGTANNNGNVLTQTITVPTVGQNNGFTAVQNYTYDELNRLKSAVENVTPTGGTASQSWKQTFTFDRYGNRRFDVQNTTTLAPGCQEAVCNPQIDPATNKLVGYTFDASGNTTIDAEGRQFTYDAENKQVQVNDASGTVGQYFYDGDGRRVKKHVPSTGETTIFVYDAASKLVAEYSTIVAAPQDAKVIYLTNDHLGSPRITTETLGQVISRRDFMPFGEEIFRTNYGSDSVRQKFTGYERDTETDLDYAKARIYVTGLARFVSADNVAYSKTPDPQTWNQYEYCRNGPLSRADRDGHNWFYVNKQWEWHDGDTYKYSYTDKKGKEHSRTLHSPYEYLIVTIIDKSQPTGRGGYYSTTVLYGSGYQDVRAFDSGYVGARGSANRPLPDGNYFVDAGIVSGPSNNVVITTTLGGGNVRYELGAVHFGIQRNYPAYSEGRLVDFRPIWGNLRANLSRPNYDVEGQPKFNFSAGTAYYMHGHDTASRGAATLGCIGTPSESVLNYMLRIHSNGNPIETKRIPVRVQSVQ